MNVGIYDFIWLIIGIAFLIADSFVGFVFFPIYISAFLVFIIDLFINNVFIEVILFIIFAVFIFILFKPRIKRFMNNMPKITNKSFASVGDEFFVEEVSTDGYSGKIKKDGIFYNIFCDEKLYVNDRVIVTKIDGLKLFVKKIKSEE